MFNWLKKKAAKHLYKVEYVQSASISGSRVEFNLANKLEVLVYADDLLDAQKIFASKVMITPHVYIHKISRIDAKPLCE